ncbi:MAG: LPS export ABC transporter periplasmic protein LptC [Spirochaetales bacterium]|nr:LPS export ABC transporter periplasmic protein LptC [Spirochaetales bacterium]
MIKLLLLLLLLTSCSFKENKGEVSSPIENPTLILNNANYTLGMEGENPVFLKGDTIKIWELSNKAVLDNITFYQTDENDAVTMKGKADRAEIDTKTQKTIFSGNVELEQLSNNYFIKTSELVYDVEAQKINTEERMEVYFPDGKLIGVGLEANLKSNIFTTGAIEEGELKQ